MELRDLIRNFEFQLRDLALTGILVSPIWLLLGLVSGDTVTTLAAITVALVSTVHVKPELAARLRVASAVRLRPSQR